MTPTAAVYGGWVLGVVPASLSVRVVCEHVSLVDLLSRKREKEIVLMTFSDWNMASLNTLSSFKGRSG